jgi:hypothetical protein
MSFRDDEPGVSGKRKNKDCSRERKCLDLKRVEINGGWRNLNNKFFGKHY